MYVKISYKQLCFIVLLAFAGLKLTESQDEYFYSTHLYQNNYYRAGQECILRFKTLAVLTTRIQMIELRDWMLFELRNLRS